MKSGVDKYMGKVLARNAEVRKAFWEEFSKSPIWTQIAVLRREHNLSQHQLAKRLHMPQPQVARMERPGQLERLAKVLHCHLTVLPTQSFMVAERAPAYGVKRARARKASARAK